jgi:hypothetical protein
LILEISIIIVAALAGAGIGIWSASQAYKRVSAKAGIKNGPWHTNLANGSEKADPYTRASVAVNGILALRQSETIYYGSRVDDNGDWLNGDKVYRIEGNKPDARWWSITLYGTDYFLIPNELNRYSYNMNNVKYDESGKFTFYVSNTPREGYWLPLNNNKRFALTLRLYNPGDSVRNNPATVELPHIIAEGN